MVDDVRIILALLGEADEQTLSALTQLPLAPLWQDEAICVANGRFVLEAGVAEGWRRELNQRDPQLYRELHERAYAVLVAQIEGGQHENEKAWTAVFERLANLYFADDTAALLQLMQQVATVPLQRSASQQMRRYFQGVVAFRQDRYGEAEQIFDSLLAEEEVAVHLQARAFNARAIVYRVTGRLEAAMAGYRASLALWQAVGAPLYQGMVHLNLGVVAYGLRQYDVANRHLHEAEAFFEQAGATEWVRKVQSELGLVQRDLGHWQEALDCFDAYVAQSQQAGVQKDVGVGEANRGEVLLFKGDLSGAKTALKTALNLLVSRTYRVDHLLYLGLAYQAEGALAKAADYYQQALHVAQEIGRQEILPHVYYHLGDVWRRRGDDGGALGYFSQAAEVIEQSSQPLHDDALKISLLGRWQQVYEALVLHCLRLGRVADAFAWAERAKARAFADAFEPPEAALSIASVREIQAALPVGTTMLFYFTTGVLAQDVPLLQAIPAANPLREHILLPARTFCFTLTSDSLTVRDCLLNPNLFTTQSPRGLAAARFLKTAVLQRLRRDLLGEAWSPVSRLLVVPHGPLHRVPFTALFSMMSHSDTTIDENEATGRAHLFWGAERPFLTFAPSGTIYVRQRAMARPLGDGCLAVGYNGDVGNGRYLRYTEAEVKQVAQIMGGEAWCGHEAKKVRLQMAAASRRWLHIACHGWFDDADPLASYLETGIDEKLTAGDVLQSWALGAELVTLSACETGVSQILRGDEPMGLVRAFLTAGARAVLVTQWPMDDLATFLLMRRFYQLIDKQEKVDLSVALHQAQTWLCQLTSEQAVRMVVDAAIEPASDWQQRLATAMPFASPLYWAGFILVGYVENG